MIIQPKHFQRIGTSTCGDTMYQLLLIGYIPVPVLKALDVTRDYDKFRDGGWFFVSCQTNKLPLLCKRLNQLFNKEIL